MNLQEYNRREQPALLPGPAAVSPRDAAAAGQIGAGTPRIAFAVLHSEPARWVSASAPKAGRCLGWPVTVIQVNNLAPPAGRGGSLPQCTVAGAAAGPFVEVAGQPAAPEPSPVPACPSLAPVREDSSEP